MSTALPPGPRVTPLRQLYQWSVRPLEMLDECQRRFGDIFTIRLAGYGTIVMLTSPDLIRDVFRGDPHVLHSGEANEFLALTVGRNSILVLDDEPHRQQRQVQLPAFKGERMRSFFQALVQRTQRHINRWPEQRPFAIDESMRDITLGVILEATLGLTDGPEFDDLARRLKSFLALGATRWALFLTKIAQHTRLFELPMLPYARQLRAIDARLFSLLGDRRALLARSVVAIAEDHDILDDLLAARYENGNMLTDQEVRDAIMTTLLAGHETTATALSWAFEQILGHPEVEQRLRRTPVGDRGRTITSRSPSAAGVLGCRDQGSFALSRGRAVCHTAAQTTHEPGRISISSRCAIGAVYPFGSSASGCVRVSRCVSAGTFSGAALHAVRMVAIRRWTSSLPGNAVRIV